MVAEQWQLFCSWASRTSGTSVRSALGTCNLWPFARMALITMVASRTQNNSGYAASVAVAKPVSTSMLQAACWCEPSHIAFIAPKPGRFVDNCCRFARCPPCMHVWYFTANTVGIAASWSICGISHIIDLSGFSTHKKMLCLMQYTYSSETNLYKMFDCCTRMKCTPVWFVNPSGSASDLRGGGVYIVL